MKKLNILFGMVSSLLMSTTVFSQDFQINVKSTLTYKFTEFDKPVTYVFTIDSLTPNLTFEWENSNKEDNFGVGTVMTAAQASAINLTFFYSSIHPVVMYDRLPSFMVSNKIYGELKKAGESRIRLQDNDNTNELQVVGSEDFEINVDDKTQNVKVIHAILFGSIGQEIWIVDNPEMPIVAKLKADKVYELKSIKTQ